MKIAVLGGRFDPPHLWHYWIAEQVLEHVPEIEQVWLMPAYKHPWKEFEAAPEDRWEMLKFLVTDKIRLSNLEIGRFNVSYTIDTVLRLKEDAANKYYWIVGSDAISDFSRWRESQKLAQMIEFLVFPRIDYPIHILPNGFRKVDSPNLILNNISSTKIRNRVKKGKSIKGLVFPGVEEYIKNKNLYK
ncbi:MAG: putative nicotinate-nucleotide adenylyltransferase [Candidatus Gottesmanbacteria bacterium GW2011_GWA2_41_12]|uniref:Probable nicotinate-nucleotide adenylyltransferase n=2 Tax=Candidatus Gottesmaniibacteriota TaxID=1752720 RepID=A0A0G0UHQ1_9BACT|nr:MAG: putative nicotinate-nucleotide adenylyltransferase [Candidatus Gottesmanbacteria bacterium GW2011_GWC2_39_8]KKR88359.1 MAG: putative nicotinate-nucleotide adenylyltransferase [Candidatus Gottesmanbacteria bacterium GW2011_GWA2_41_12]